MAAERKAKHVAADAAAAALAQAAMEAEALAEAERLSAADAEATRAECLAALAVLRKRLADARISASTDFKKVNGLLSSSLFIQS